MKIISTDDYSLQSIHDIKILFCPFCITLRDSRQAAELYRLKFDFKTLKSFHNIKELKT